MDEKNLCDLEVGSSGRVTGLAFDGAKRRRMLDLGLVAGTRVTALHESPSGDPVAYRIRGSVIAFRRRDAEKIRIVTE